MHEKLISRDSNNYNFTLKCLNLVHRYRKHMFELANTTPLIIIEICSSVRF